MNSKEGSKIDSRTKSQYDKKFVFVLVNESTDATTQKQFRAHAMREAMRQRQLRTKNDSEEATQIPFKTGRYRLPSASSKAKPRRKPKSKAGDNQISASVDVQGAYPPFSSGKTMVVVPSRGRLDPFNSAPIHLGLKQQQILHYC